MRPRDNLLFAALCRVMLDAVVRGCQKAEPWKIPEPRARGSGTKGVDGDGSGASGSGASGAGASGAHESASFSDRPARRS
jgi:hypothetical protein